MIDTDAVLKLLGEKSRVVARVGRYVGVVGGQAIVDIDQSRFPTTFLTGFLPVPNDPVHVWSVNGMWFLVGPASGRPSFGVVTTVTGGRVTVTSDFGNFTMPHIGAAPTSGDTVGISWPGPVCLGRLSVQPDVPVTPTDPGSGGGLLKDATFMAVDAGSTDRGSARWWTGQPWASSSTYGAWFYGTQIKDTVPAGSAVESMEIFIRRVQDQGDAPRFTLHTSAYKGGVPGMSPYLTWDPPNGWNQVPAGWASALIGGGGYWGVGLNQGGWNKFASLAEDGFSGALRIKWR